MYILPLAFSRGFRGPFFSDVVMEIIRILWIVNFFLFLLTLIFVWSKLYSISQRMNDIISIIKKSDELFAEKKH
jgi:hypothetical protein